jgi:gliding motility-associated lipoprotein GldH
MQEKNSAVFFLILTTVLLFSSCSSNLVFDSNTSLPIDGWHKDNKVVFKVEINDTVNLHDLYVNVRNSTSYTSSNLFLFLDIGFPDGKQVRDTLECIIAEKSGKWTGKGFGRIKSNQFLFRTDAWFPQVGVYSFTFQQAMRDPNLEGVTDIGLSIERK